MKTQHRTWLLAALLVAAVAGLWGWQLNGAKGPDVPAPAGAIAAIPVPVTTAIAVRRDVPVVLEGLGAVQAYNAVTVHTRVDGELERIAFTEGEDVKAGDVLAQIDPRGYQAALDQALAKKVQDEAAAANARADRDRYATLVAKQYVTQQQYDTAKAQAQQYAAAVLGDEAAIENARVQLSYTTIRSPIDGRVGIRKIDQGNIIHANDAGGIVVITQVQPISVLFTLPQEALVRVVKAMAAGRLPVTAMSRDGKLALDRGTLDLVDNQIDASTGTVRLKATMPNADGMLWPGQFVNARLLVETRAQAVTVPATAVQRGQQGTYAYVVDQGNVVEARPLVAGQGDDDVIVVESGINAGEVVVTAGQYRLRPGSKVEAKK